MKNNAHNESKYARLERFRSNAPVEAIETLLNSIDNFFNNEISLTPTHHQTSLLLLGIHSVALTIAHLLHDWRNILAHQWLGSVGHKINYNYQMNNKGFVQDGDVTTINPRIYCDRYLEAFSAGGKVWQYEHIFSNSELETIKNRIIAKFEKN